MEQCSTFPKISLQCIFICNLTLYTWGTKGRKHNKCFLPKIKLKLKSKCNWKQYICHFLWEHQHWQKGFVTLIEFSLCMWGRGRWGGRGLGWSNGPNGPWSNFSRTVVHNARWYITYNFSLQIPIFIAFLHQRIFPVVLQEL